MQCRCKASSSNKTRGSSSRSSRRPQIRLRAAACWAPLRPKQNAARSRRSPLGSRQGAWPHLKPPGRYQFRLPPPVPQLSISNWSATPDRSTTAQHEAEASLAVERPSQAGGGAMQLHRQQGGPAAGTAVQSQLSRTRLENSLGGGAPAGKEGPGRRQGSAPGRQAHPGQPAFQAPTCRCSPSTQTALWSFRCPVRCHQPWRTPAAAAAGWRLGYNCRWRAPRVGTAAAGGPGGCCTTMAAPPALGMSRCACRRPGRRLQAAFEGAASRRWPWQA